MSCGSFESLTPEPSDFQTSNIRDRHDSPQVMRRKIQLPQTGVAFTECLQDALRGARGACTGNRYGEMLNSANLGGFASKERCGRIAVILDQISRSRSGKTWQFLADDMETDRSQIFSGRLATAKSHGRIPECGTVDSSGLTACFF